MSVEATQSISVDVFQTRSRSPIDRSGGRDPRGSMIEAFDHFDGRDPPTLQLRQSLDHFDGRARESRALKHSQIHTQNYDFT